MENLVRDIKLTIKDLLSRKGRSFLTILGIIIGVASVITMLAIGEGSKQSIKGQISDMGSNMIFVMPNFNREGVTKSASSMESLKIKDCENIKEECPHVKELSPVVNSSGQLIYGDNNHPISVTGASPSYLEIRKLTIQDGMMFTEQDVKSSTKVCVIGKTVVDKLFTEGEDPIGKIIRYNSIPFKIVGVLKSKGSSTMGQDQDDVMIAPYTTIQKRVLAITHIQTIFTSATTENDSQKAIAEITDVLNRNHKIQEGQEADFEIKSQQELMQTIDTVTSLITTLLGSIAGISLLVGGIGIMNIMYVSVTERTKEIGLRMSVGARGRDVLSQFLVEAIILSVSGGVLGIIFGVSISYIVKLATGYAISVSTFSIVLAYAVCTIIGIFFGWYPAKKAANLDPIEAIRYE